MLDSLNPNKASGPDMISPVVLKNLADVLSTPLAQLCQTAINTWEVPKQWKTAVVLSIIFKKGDKQKPANYCPPLSGPLVSGL